MNLAQQPEIAMRIMLETPHPMSQRLPQRHAYANARKKLRKIMQGKANAQTKSQAATPVNPIPTLPLPSRNSLTVRPRHSRLSPKLVTANTVTV